MKKIKIFLIVILLLFSCSSIGCKEEEPIIEFNSNISSQIHVKVICDPMEYEEFLQKPGIKIIKVTRFKGFFGFCWEIYYNN